MRRRLAQRGRRCAALMATIGALVVCGGSRAAFAHEIHTTHTALTADATGYTLVVRAFADDLSASVAAFRGRAAPRDSSVPLPDLLAYASARLTVMDTRGVPLPMTSCGVQRLPAVYLVCLRVLVREKASTLRIGNQMLAERHADQVNIVQCELAGTRRTSLFTRHRPPVAVVAKGRCAAS